jgi:hypothetical protein
MKFSVCSLFLVFCLLPFASLAQTPGSESATGLRVALSEPGQDLLDSGEFHWIQRCNYKVSCRIASLFFWRFRQTASAYGS